MSVGDDGRCRDIVQMEGCYDRTDRRGYQEMGVCTISPQNNMGGLCSLGPGLAYSSFPCGSWSPKMSKNKIAVAYCNVQGALARVERDSFRSRPRYQACRRDPDTMEKGKGCSTVEARGAWHMHTMGD